MATNPSEKLLVFFFSEYAGPLNTQLARELGTVSRRVQYCQKYEDALIWISQNCDNGPDVVIIDVPSERSIQSMNAFNLYSFVHSGGWVNGMSRRFLGWADDVPIVMLVDVDKRHSVEERMYELGINPDKLEYKPYRLHILSNKLRQLVDGSETSAVAPSVLQAGSIKIDIETESAAVNASPLKLSHLEFKLLHYLALHANKPVSREQILKDIWGITGAKATNSRNVDVYVGRLRKKLAAVGCRELINRGNNGTYLLQTTNIVDEATITETEDVEDRNQSNAGQFGDLRDAKLLKESLDSHLPPNFTLGAAKILREYRAGIKIGRNRNSCDFVINDKRISRWHATIFTDRNYYYIRDEDSKGCTYVLRADESSQADKTRILPREHIQLQHNDIIYFHTVAYRFELPE